MSAAALFILMLSTSQPGQVPSLDSSEPDRTPIRCRPAPYYVSEQGGRPKSERLLVTGSRVPLTTHDEDRRPRPPCLLMRDDGPPNPLRPAD